MALRKTEAIVLRSRHLGETSKILILFTERFGKLAVVAKGARRPKSRFGASLDLFARSSVVLYLKENRDLGLVTESTLVEGFYGLREDARRLGQASAVVEWSTAWFCGPSRRRSCSICSRADSGRLNGGIIPHCSCRP